KSLFCAFMFTFIGCAFGQDLPEAPSTHKFWDKTNQALILTHVGLEAADFTATHRNLSAGGRELNPTAKALCESGTRGQGVLFAGEAVGGAGVSYFPHKTNHHKLERPFLLGANASSAFGASYSFAHH